MVASKIDFEIQTPYGKYCDALHFWEGQIPSDEEIETLKQERVNNWIAVLTGPSPPEDPVPNGK
jgi:hypothetical protein